MQTQIRLSAVSILLGQGQHLPGIVPRLVTDMMWDCHKCSTWEGAECGSGLLLDLGFYALPDPLLLG